MPQGKGTYGKKKGRPPKKMMGGGMAGMPKMMARGGQVTQAERKAMGGISSMGKEVMKKLGLGSGKGPLSNKDKSIAGVASQAANAAKLMKMVSKTKGAISDKEMEMFIKSSPKKKKPIKRGKPGYNRK
tara:strand:+ start:113 stop:499 length:387 start_codon:yes stop_codon:yes gene_type:complete